MLWLKFLRKLFRILNGEVEPRQIALGIAFGAILGLTPLFNLHNLIVLLLICIIRVNVSSVIFSTLLFSLLSYLVDPLSDWLGHLLLVKASFLTPFWTVLYNMPIVPWTNFNNTLVLGSLVFSLMLFYPNVVLSRKGVIVYRISVQPKLEKIKIVRVLQGTRVYQWYKKISSWRE